VVTAAGTAKDGADAAGVGEAVVGAAAGEDAGAAGGVGVGGGGFGWGAGWGWGPYWGFGWGYPGWYYPGLAWGAGWDPYWYDPGLYNDDFSYYNDNANGAVDPNGYDYNSVYPGPDYANPPDQSPYGGSAYTPANPNFVMASAGNY